MRPVPDADTKPYWDGVAEGELRLQRCEDCGDGRFLPARGLPALPRRPAPLVHRRRDRPRLLVYGGAPRVRRVRRPDTVHRRTGRPGRWCAHDDPDRRNRSRPRPDRHAGPSDGRADRRHEPALLPSRSEGPGGAGSEKGEAATRNAETQKTQEPQIPQRRKRSRRELQEAEVVQEAVQRIAQEAEVAQDVQKAEEVQRTQEAKTGSTEPQE